MRHQLQDALNAPAAEQVRKDANLERRQDWRTSLPAAPPLQGYEQWMRAWQEVKRS